MAIRQDIDEKLKKTADGFDRIAGWNKTKTLRKLPRIPKL
jgi:hypothetical protein